MNGKFSAPKNEAEFIERVGPVTIAGAKAVSNALKKQIAAKVGPLQAEVRFFEEAIKYKTTGTLPERFKRNGKTT